jgi:hypothetical protein
MESGAQLIYQHDLYFDGGDAANGSLYLCAAPGTPAAQVGNVIDYLRGEGLWSAAAPRQVTEAQKPVYAEQMKFVDSFAVARGDGALTAARFDHPKYPSSAERWSAWRKALGV